MKSQSGGEDRAVVVTTAKRGVFFGYGAPVVGGKGTLKDARMCVTWSSDVRGVLGLAVSGPTAGCRITPAVPVLEIDEITAVMDCTAEAVKAWESQPWAEGS